LEKNIQFFKVLTQNLGICGSESVDFMTDLCFLVVKVSRSVVTLNKIWRNFAKFGQISNI
jgi:hypothetical protein